MNTNTNTELSIELQAQVARLYACLDKEDVRGHMSYFADGATFESRFGTITGREEIQKFMDAHVASGMERGVRHFLSNFYIDAADQNVATLRFYIAKVQVRVGPKVIGSAAAECQFDLTKAEKPVLKLALEIDPASLTSPEK